MKKISKNRIKRLLTAALIMALAMGGMPEFMGGGAPFVYAGKKAPKNPRVTYYTRETVQFGQYYQDSDTVKQPITWQILTTDDQGYSLLLSDKILDVRPYDEDSSAATWKDSDLYHWLNDDSANSFRKIAFTDEEYSRLEDKGAGKVSIPDIATITNPAYGFNSDPGYGDEARLAFLVGRPLPALPIPLEDIAYYWLLDVGGHGDAGYKAGYIMNNGCIDADSAYQVSPYGIRPLIWAKVENYAKSSKNVRVTGATYDHITLGNFNGEDITWRVLNVSGDDAFLLSDKILTQRYVNNPLTGFEPWASCDLRIWLNTHAGGFYNTAFSEEEKKAIKLSEITNIDVLTPTIETTTKDYVFLPSYKDMTTTDYGFPAYLYCCSDTRVALDDTGNPTTYSLRTEAKSGASFFSIDSKGRTDYFYNILQTPPGVRPALHVSLSALGYDLEATDPEDDQIITLSPTKKSFTVYTDKKYRFVPTEKLLGKDNTLVSLDTKNHSIATIDPDGTLHLYKKGSTAIKIKVKYTKTVKKSEKVKYTDSKGKTKTKTVKKTVTEEKTKIISCSMKVKEPLSVKKVSLNKAKVTFDLNKKDTSFVLQAKFSPKNVPNKNVRFESQNPDIVSVSQNGTEGKATIKALKEGTATIKATSLDKGNKTKTCTVTVKDSGKVTGVKLNKKKAKIKLRSNNKTLQLASTIKPKSARNKKVTWESSDSSVAVVDAKGMVTALKAGKATITAKTEEGGFMASCGITVTNK